MISAIYIAAAANRLDLELKIIRHFLINSQTKEVRDAFISAEMKSRSKSMKRFIAQKPDRDWLDDFLAPTVLRTQERWLANNLSHLKEFSENRLNQMELILRYTLFEGFLQKIIGNILWEYPELRTLPIHIEMDKHQIRRPKRLRSDDPDKERITWTKAAVDAVDRLPFAEWNGETRKNRNIYLWSYLRDAFKIEFPDPKLWPTLERLRQIRNHVIHKSMEVTIMDDRMSEAQIYLGNFPVVLTERAAKLFPKACTEAPPEDGDDGTPSYIILQEFY